MKVLVSKADLPAPLDLESELRYTAGQIRAQLGVEVDVHPVSTAHSQAHLLEQWGSAEIAPLYEAHGQFARESGRRKTAALCETVEAVLNAKLNGAVSVPEEQKEKLLVLERDLREAAGRLEDARVFCLRVSDEIRGLTPDALHQATSALLEVWTGAALNKEPETAVAAAIAKTAGRATQVHSYLRDLALILTAALQRTAQALGSDDASAEEEPLRPLREMPRFDPPPLDERFHRPWILRPRGLARSWIHGQLRRALEESLTEAFSAHARLVENWARQALAELQLRFDSSADAYRAQLARLTARGSVATEVQSAIAGYLVCLAQTGGEP